MKQCSICGVVGSYTSNCTPECRKEYRRTLDQFKEKQRKLQETGHKICTTCKQIRRYDGFSKDKGRKEGISNRCKICDVKRFRKFYKEEKSRPKLEYVVPKSKICTRCKESKSIDQFLKRRERGNFQAYCIPCQAAYRREKYSKEQKQDSEWKWWNELNAASHRALTLSIYGIDSSDMFSAGYLRRNLIVLLPHYALLLYLCFRVSLLDNIRGILVAGSLMAFMILNLAYSWAAAGGLVDRYLMPAYFLALFYIAQSMPGTQVAPAQSARV